MIYSIYKKCALAIETHVTKADGNNELTQRQLDKLWELYSFKQQKIKELSLHNNGK